MLGEAGLGTYERASEDPGCKGKDSRVVYRFIGGDEKWEEKIGRDGKGTAE
jgi:3-hydroxyisobutyrate dehydrogenase